MKIELLKLMVRAHYFVIIFIEFSSFLVCDPAGENFLNKLQLNFYVEL